MTAVSIRRTAFLRCDPDLAAVGYVTVVRFPVEGSVSAHCGAKLTPGEKIVRTGLISTPLPPNPNIGHC